MNLAGDTTECPREITISARASALAANATFDDNANEVFNASLDFHNTSTCD
jgi:ribonuclease BN (tRNA processing enzyme)